MLLFRLLLQKSHRGIGHFRWKNFSPSAALSKDLPFPHWSLKSTGEKRCLEGASRAMCSDEARTQLKIRDTVRVFAFEQMHRSMNQIWMCV